MPNEAKQRQTNLRLTDVSTLVNGNNWAWQSAEAVGRRRQWQGKQRTPNRPPHLSGPAGQRERADGRANTPLHFDLQAAAPAPAQRRYRRRYTYVSEAEV